MTTEITINPPPFLSPYQAGKPKPPSIVNEDFFTKFSDLFDAVNPLQHIPGIATAYRAISGDEISSGAKLLGSMLFGGPVGLVASIANAIIEQETGKDIGEKLFAAASKAYEKPASA